MYNQEVINRLNNLTYLFALKNANVTAMTKKNEFGDVVKFFAQINSNNVIQKISYKASGCSAFMAICSYFCEIVTNKTIDEAKKINETDLEKFSKLDSQKTHVYKIVLDTFDLLLKKYEKGLKKGTITPCEPVEPKVEETKKTKKSISKRTNAHIDEELKEILSVDTDKKSKQTETPKNTQVIKTTTTTRKVTKIVSQTPVVEKVDLSEISEPKVEQTSGNVSVEEKVVTSKTSITQEKIDTPKKSFDAVDIANRLKSQTAIVKDNENKKAQDSQVNQNKMSHINALNLKIKNKETNEKMQSNSKSLSDMLSRIHSANVNSSKASSQKIEVETKQESIESQKDVGTKKSKKEENLKKKTSQKRKRNRYLAGYLAKSKKINSN